MKDLIHSVASSAKALGILDETAYRNLCYKLEFEEKINSGENAEDVMEEMSERYCLSISSIDLIVYPRGEKKEKSDKIIAEVLKIKKKNRRVHYNRRRRT